ncbi:MAG: GNAT family N-acetyltransferase [Acidimicrobiales bacterium]
MGSTSDANRNGNASIEWRADFTSVEATVLHAAAFNTRLHAPEEWDWRSIVERHSLGWCTARSSGELVGFANVVTDGFVHSWLQDVMVLPTHQRSGIGQALVALAVDRSREAGCEWLHVDFDDEMADFYFKACGFTYTNAGLYYLQ